MATTLATLRTRAQQRADMESFGGVASTEWTTFINEAYAELWDMVIAACGDHFVSSADFTVTATAGTITLPADCYKVVGVDADPGTDNERPVRQFDWASRNRQSSVRYRLMGSLIYFEPRNDSAGSYRLWYTPGHTALAGESDTISTLLERWEEYIVIGAAIRGLKKKELDTTDLERDRARVAARVATMATFRDESQGGSVSDVKGFADYNDEDDIPRMR